MLRKMPSSSPLFSSFILASISRLLNVRISFEKVKDGEYRSPGMLWADWLVGWVVGWLVGW